MKHEDIDVALTKATLNLRTGAAAPRTAPSDLPIDRCLVAQVVIDFLYSLKNKSPWYVRLGINLIVGKIGEWKRSQGCS